MVQNRKIMVEAAYLTPHSPTRQNVLIQLWRRAEWLRKIIENKRSKLNQNMRTRVYFASVECQIYRTILQGLSTEELELRVMSLEKKLKNGVLIPKNEQSK